MAATVEELEEQIFKAIGPRLGETLSAFEALSTINRVANPDDGPDIFERVINKYPRFWETVLLGEQSTVIVGIGALCDKRKDVASIQSLLDDLSPQMDAALAADLAMRLDKVRDKYVRYRHKLFGHTDKDSQGWAAKFDNAGFNFEDMRSDLDELSYVFKVLFEQVSGRKLPTFDEAKQMHFPYEDRAKGAREQTEALLRASLHI